MKEAKALRALPLLVVAALAPALPAVAGTSTWTGDTDTSWGTATNWSPAAPLAADTVRFDATSTANLETTLAANTTVAGIQLANPPGAVSIGGTFTLAAGAIDTGAVADLKIANGSTNGSLTFTGLAGSRTLTIQRGGQVNLTATLNAANAVNFTGTLALRGATATTSPNPVGGNWTAFGGGAVSQSAGTAFALDTGSSTDGARDFIITDGWNGKTLTLSSLSGTGTIRADWGGAGTRTLRVDQAGDTTFSGLLLSHTSSAGVVRSVALQKAGAGTLTMTGLLAKQTASAGGANSDIPLTVEAGTLVLTANNTRTGATTINPAATLRLGNGGTTGLPGNAAATITNHGTLVLDYGPGAAVTLANPIGGTGSVTKHGAGEAVLTGTSDYAGATTVAQGTLRVGGTLASTVTVQPGAVLAVGSATAPGNGTIGGLAAAAGSTLAFRVGGATETLTVAGTFAAGTNPGDKVKVRPAIDPAAVPDTYTLIDYSGSLGGAGFAALELDLLQHLGLDLVDDAPGGTVQVTYDGTVDSLVWNGDASGEWETNGDANWKLASDSSAAPAYQLDKVLFNDAATGTTNVTLVGSITPAELTIDNSTLAYTLQGAPVAGPVKLVKNGTRTATLLNNNTYTGGTEVNRGTLAFGSGGDTGEIGLGPVTVAAPATLLIDRDPATLLDYKASQRLRTVAGAGHIVLDGGLTLFNYPGTGTGFAEPNSWAGFSGTLTVKGGSEFRTIRQGATAMGTGTVVLGDATSSGSLAQIEGSWTWNTPVSLLGGTNKIINRSSTAFPRYLKLLGPVSGAGGLTFEDATPSMTDNQTGFILAGDNQLTGTITVPAGVPLRVGGVPGNDGTSAAGPAGSLGSATITNHGTLTFARTDAHTVSNTINGDGAVFVGIAAGTAAQVVTYTGSGSWNGTTTVRNGTLVIAAGAAVVDAQTNVQATGTLVVNGSHGAPLGQINVAAGGTLAGTGTTAADIFAAGTVAPGASAGTLTTTGWATFGPGSTFACGIADWSGTTPGTHWDLLLADTLVINVAPDLDPDLTIAISGPAAGFGESNKTIRVATAATALNGFDLAAITIDDTAFKAATGATGTWAVQQNGRNLELVYTAGIPDFYAQWAAPFALANPAFDFDSDGDGVDNGLEWILGGNPTQQDAATILPKPAGNAATGLTLTFTREEDSVGQATLQVQWDDNLDGTWAGTAAIGAAGPIPDPAPGGVTVTVNQAANPDQVTVNIPASNASNGRLFAHLAATRP